MKVMEPGTWAKLKHRNHSNSFTRLFDGKYVKIEDVHIYSSHTVYAVCICHIYSVPIGIHFDHPQVAPHELEPLNGLEVAKLKAMEKI
jgi:hypothetical protein